MVGETVYTINNGTCEAVSSLLALLKKNDIQVVFKFNPGMEMFWEPAFTRGIQLFPLCFQDILINMTVVPFEQEFLLPYGIFYRSNPTPPVRSFLDFIRSTYENGNISGIVPVLQLR